MVKPDWTLEELTAGVNSIGIGGHISPDGDCIGASAALGLYLKKLRPDAVIEIFLDQLQTEFKGLPGTSRIRTNYNPSVSPFDLFFSLDCGKDRLGEAEKFFDAAKIKVNIDHHVSNPGTGEYNYIVPDASSTCELVYALMNRDLVDAEIAQSIYTRHKVLTQLLISLGVDPVIAREDACKIEHDLTDESFEAIRRHTESLA